MLKPYVKPALMPLGLTVVWQQNLVIRKKIFGSKWTAVIISNKDEDFGLLIKDAIKAIKNESKKQKDLSLY